MIINILSVILFILIFTFSIQQQSCIRPLKQTQSINEEIQFLQIRHFRIIKSDEDTEPFAKARIPYKKKHNFDQLDIVLTILSMTDFYDIQGISLQLYPIPSETYFYTVIQYKKTTRWSEAYINYIISSREEIKLGNFLVMNDQFQKSQKNKSIVQVKSPLKLSLSKNKGVKAYVFLTGLVSQSQTFQITILSGIVSNNVLTSQILLDQNKKGIERIRISYLLVQPRRKFILNLIDTVSQEQGFIRFQKRNKRPILGIVSYNGTKFLQNMNKKVKNRFLQEQKPNYVIEHASQLDLPSWQTRRLQMAFTIVEMDIVNIGLLTPIAQRSPIFNTILRKIFMENKCMTYQSCKEYKGNVHISTQYQSCIFCQQNEKFNTQTGECQCLPGFVRVRQVCINQMLQCGPTRKLGHDECREVITKKELCSLKNMKYNNETDQCECKGKGYIDKSINNQDYCFRQCPYGQFNIYTQQCDCIQGFEIVNDKCTLKKTKQQKVQTQNNKN